MTLTDIVKDLELDYQEQVGWACVAWKDREIEGHFEQRFYQWPTQKAEMADLILLKSDADCCVWKPTALLTEARRAEAMPSNVLSFEVDQQLSDVGKRLLKRIDPTVLRSGRPRHYHIKVYLDQDLGPDDNAYWTKYLASAMGITSKADSGGKFNPHDLLRIAGTRNTKPDVNKVVTYAHRTRRGIALKRLRAILSTFTAPNETTLALHNIDRIEVPEDRIPEAVAARLRELSGEDRSEQTYAFVQLCKEEGLPPGYILELANYHTPTRERNNYDERRIAQDVIRCWNKGNRTAHEVEDAIFATPELQFLYNEAKKRRVSPTSALGTALIHAGLAVPPWFLLPPIIGGVGTGVNLIIVNVGPSGAGKGVTGAAILEVPKTYAIESDREDDVLSQPFADAMSPEAPSSGPAFASMFVQLQAAEREGSGEGGGEKRKPGRPRHDELVQYAYARHVHWDEIDTVNTYLSDRRDTVSPELRSGWSGAALGSTTKSRENRIRVAKNSYRLMVSFDAQPERSGDLFAQTAGGLLQRVLFLSSFDKKRSKGFSRAEPATQRMRLPKFVGDGDGEGRGGFTVVDEVWKTIQEDFVESKFVGTEDAHRNLIRLKVAALLAVMHESTVVEVGWWEIAGAVLEHSDQVKGDIRKALKDADRQVQRSLGAKTAVREVARDAAREQIRDRTETRIVSLLKEKGDLRRGDLRQKLSRYQQGVFYEVLDKMTEEKLVVQKGAWITLKT